MAATNTSHTQLPLPITLRDDATLENFYPLEGHLPLLPLLQAQLTNDGESSVLLHGAAATGKSHLLQAMCHLAGDEALYLPLNEFKGYSPEAVFEGVEFVPLVVIDDLDAVLGDRGWEVALFSLCNRVRAAGTRLLFAAAGAPRSLPLTLEDLRSRLSWGVVYQMPVLQDRDKQAVLRFRAERRGLAMPEEVAVFITSRASRSLPDLLQILDRLDTQSLAHQRPLTIPFIKQILDW